MLSTDSEEINLRANNLFEKLKKERIDSSLELNDEIEAKLFARAVETQLLVSPLSAKWPDLDDIILQHDSEGNYKVLGYVDAQNSNGTYRRTEYSLTVKKRFDNTWFTTDQFVDSAQVEMAKITKQVESSSINWYIIISIIGLIFFIIEMMVSGLI